MEFQLLGAVEAWEREQQLDLGPRKQRFTFAILALQANQLVSVDKLIDLTWPTQPPRTAQHAIHVRVSRLRRAIAGARSGRRDADIVTHGSAYMLKVNPLRVDVHRFRAVVAGARQETHDAVKVSLLRHALSMWHGPALADVTTPDAAAVLCLGLEDARLAALEDCLDAELRLGKHTTVVGELTDLVARHPYRQRLQALLTMALEPGSRPSNPQRATVCADPALDPPLTRTSIRTRLPHKTRSSVRTGPPSDEIVVKAHDLSKSYGERMAVDGVSFTARKGEVLGLLGPNGAGKTTTLSMLSTVVVPSRGEFSVAGVPGSRRHDLRKLIGVLPENVEYPGHQTGVEFLIYYGRQFGLSHTEAGERAIDVLGQVGLSECARARITTYNRGMRQRLGIARALVNNPAVVLLDEPTIGLDPSSQREILTLVRTVAEARGITVLLATHTLPEVERICTGVLILERGRLVSSQVVT